MYADVVLLLDRMISSSTYATIEFSSFAHIIRVVVNSYLEKIHYSFIRFAIMIEEHACAISMILYIPNTRPRCPVEYTQCCHFRTHNPDANCPTTQFSTMPCSQKILIHPKPPTPCNDLFQQNFCPSGSPPVIPGVLCTQSV